MKTPASLNSLLLLTAFVSAFALAGFGAARLMPASSYATASIAAIGTAPALGQVGCIAGGIDSILSDRGLPSRVTASNSQINILVPPSSKPLEEVRSIITDAVKSLPTLDAPSSYVGCGRNLTYPGLDLVRKAEEFIGRYSEHALSSDSNAAPLDVAKYTQAVLAIAAASERLSALAEARSQAMPKLTWAEPQITIHEAQVSSFSMALLGGSLGLLSYLVVLLSLGTGRIGKIKSLSPL